MDECAPITAMCRERTDRKKKRKKIEPYPISSPLFEPFLLLMISIFLTSFAYIFCECGKVFLKESVTGTERNDGVEMAGMLCLGCERL